MHMCISNVVPLCESEWNTEIWHCGHFKIFLLFIQCYKETAGRKIGSRCKPKHRRLFGSITSHPPLVWGIRLTKGEFPILFFSFLTVFTHSLWLKLSSLGLKSQSNYVGRYVVDCHITLFWCSCAKESVQFSMRLQQKIAWMCLKRIDLVGSRWYCQTLRSF